MTLDWAVSSAGLILIVGLLRFVLKDRLRAGVRYAVWGLVLLRLLLPVNLGQSAVSLLNAVERTPAARTAELVETVDRVERGENGAVEGYRTRPDGGAELVFTRPATDREYQQMERALTWQTLLPLVWLAGAAVMLAALGASSLRFYARLRRSRRRLAVRCRVPVYVSGAVEAPCLAGLLRPAIYLTEAAAADPAVIRHVLAHELTHLRHRDNLWAALRGVCLALHWFDPLVWWAAAASRQDGELACDEAALRRLAPEERVAYGRTLLAMSCARAPSLLVTASTLTGGKRSLRERVSRIAHRPRAAAWALAALLLTASLAAGCTLTGAVESGTAGEDGSSGAQSAVSEPESTPPAASTSAPTATPAPPSFSQTFDQAEFISFFGDSRLCNMPGYPIGSTGELAEGPDYTRLRLLAYQYQSWLDKRQGGNAPVNEQGIPYYTVEQTEAVIEQLFGLRVELDDLARTQRARYPAPEGCLCVPWNVDYGQQTVKIDPYSISCEEGIICLSAIVCEGDGQDNEPAEDTLLYTFVFQPDSTVCPYRLESIFSMNEPREKTYEDPVLTEAHWLTHKLVTPILDREEGIDQVSPALFEEEPGLEERFLLSTTWMEERYKAYAEYSEDGMAMYVTRENAERLLDRVFGLENIPASLWQSEDYNAAARRFEFPTGIGLNDSFAPYGLTCTRVNETTVSARFTMFSGANYGGPRNLGEYEILYTVLPVEEEPRLRFQSMLPVA